MKKHALLTLIAVAFCLQSFAQDFTVNLNRLINETQLVSEDQDRMRLVWWIPNEYWEVSLAADPATAGEAANIVAVLKDYTVFAIADGEIGSFGGVTYVSKELLSDNLTIVDQHGDKFKPLSDKKVSEDTKIFLSMMKPVFASMMGPMGENMHFMLFTNENLEGKRLLDPFAEGGFEVNVFDEKLNWELPLGSLFKPKKCPIDGKEWNGTWSFCPKHGETLE